MEITSADRIIVSGARKLRQTEVEVNFLECLVAGYIAGPKKAIWVSQNPNMELGQQPIGALQRAAALAQRVASTGASMTWPIDAPREPGLPRSLGLTLQGVVFSGVPLAGDLSGQ